jgi:hypothetical protein
VGEYVLGFFVKCLLRVMEGVRVQGEEEVSLAEKKDARARDSEW